MNRETFWQLIEDSRGASGGGCEDHAEALQALLAKLPSDEILAFDAEFDACLGESYRWDLWGVAYLINNGCSDDGFEYFRCWLIAQGREYFEGALRDAQRAADRAVRREAECESILYAALSAYEELTGEEPTIERWRRLPKEPSGKQWEESELADLFPAVAARFA